MKRIIKKILNVKGIKIIDMKTVDKVRKNGLITKTLQISVKLTKGQQSRCPVCGKKCPQYDTVTTNRRWRHLDFGSLHTEVVCDTHRIECPEHGIHVQRIPWARHNSGFTEEFEKQTAYVATNGTKKFASQLMDIDWNSVGKILSRVRDDLEPDLSTRFEGVTSIGIDETSYKKGHKYITTVVDHDKNQVIWIGTGHSYDTLKQFMELLSEEQRKAIKLVSGDGASWIKKCVEEYLPNAKFCIDRYHATSWCIDALDEVRKMIAREERKSRKENKRGRGRPKKEESTKEKTFNEDKKAIKGAKYALGKNPENLTEHQAKILNQIKNEDRRLYRAYQLKEGLRAVFTASEENVEIELKAWLSWACRSKIKPMVELSRKIRRKKEDIINTVKYGISNARIEAMNNHIKNLIKKSYGFRNLQNMFDLIYIVCSSKLKEKIKPAYMLR